jgi:hypothetical protein
MASHRVYVGAQTC